MFSLLFVFFVVASAQLCAALPDTVTDYTREGTCAHELAEYKVQKLLGNPASNPTENLDFYDAEMEDCTDSYAQYIAELLATLQEPMVLVEQRLDFSRYVPDGFGTGDCVIVADSVLTVIDFKYGKGVAVSAEHNSQMMLYALGALELFDALYDIAEIRMVIFQPRIQNLSECTLPLLELLHWAETELKPKAALAAKGDGDFCAGEHCRFCKVKATCRKQAEYNLQLAKYDFAMPDKLTDTEIEAILETADQLVAWASDIKEYALQQSFPGFLLCSAGALALIDALRTMLFRLSHLAQVADVLPVAAAECVLSLVWSPLVWLLFRRVYRRVGGDKLA